jgi:kynurenine formamidase
MLVTRTLTFGYAPHLLPSGYVRRSTGDPAVANLACDRSIKTAIRLTYPVNAQQKNDAKDTNLAHCITMPPTYPPIFDTPYNSLPNPKRVWIGTPGSHEEGLGKLALLTPSLVASAAKHEIRTGRRVSLNWELTKLEPAGLGRQSCEHKIIPLGSGFEGVAYDDVYRFNPQQSSQWDGSRHFSQPAGGNAGESERVFYGGTTTAEIEDRGNTRIGMQHWAKEGIAGRGVLIDYAGWAEKRGIVYSTFSTHEIKLDDIRAIAEECSIEFQKGDILIVRIGMTKEWDNKMTTAEKEVYATNPHPEHAGVEASQEVLRFLWDTQFAAVAGDAISWEVSPPNNNKEKEEDKVFLHEYLLAGWGMPIGEMFDLEALAEICREEGRWTFFVTSAPFNMPGGVSSPPNCMALF